MKTVCVTLAASPEQVDRLRELQAAFARVCDAVVSTMREHRCWNRVTLHHLAYKPLREQFPDMGSQMVCNAIYAVSVVSRILFQHPDSPLHHTKLVGRPLPLLRFTDKSPVYFDRNTVSYKKGTLSVYTLKGRARFRADLSPVDATLMESGKLRDIVLASRSDGAYELQFNFLEPDAEPAPVGIPPAPRQFPRHVQIEMTP